uniref:A-kinase anchor protein 1, mitochondrial n=1 Tax=Lygus hesperus TaxID=30085 RepID=A0A0A9YJ96_LYGHE
MLRGDSRQLLILGIPTITLVFGLLFLRHRRRKRGTLHTDPGGITDSTLNHEFLLEEEAEELLLKKPIQEAIPLAEDAIIATAVKTTESPVDPHPLELDIVPANAVSSYCTSTKVVDIEKSPGLEEKRVAEVIDLTREENIVDFVDLTEDASESFATDREEGELTRTTFSDCSFDDISFLNSPGVEEASKKIEVASTSADPVVSTGAIENVGLEEGELLDSSVEEVCVAEEATESSAKEETAVIPATEEVKESSPQNMKKGEQGELVDKLVNLELDSMNMGGSTERKGGSSERDSANHSPSEVMLASPSISNFSDAHSEGSSDSGKGHSDVATSPSRTPAGGSSLAGDLALSVYEFLLPQGIVGRLIGRHGASLHEIRSSTGTNIFIKRHPETNKLKICAIEGTQQDIDKALAKIRQKFPIRRFPQLTLEKVSFVTLNNVPPLKLEDFHLQLVEGVNNDVILSSLITAAHFFLQQPSHPSYSSLSALNTIMNTVYNSPEAPVLDPPIKDAVCAVPTMGGWYRAQIISVSEEERTAYVRFLDYGGFLVVDAASLRQIRGDLLTLPFQAVECYLANVAPAEGKYWSEEARLFVQSLTHGQVLQAQIYEYAEDGTPLVYLYSSFDNEVILINEELVARGFATLAKPLSEKAEDE